MSLHTGLFALGIALEVCAFGLIIGMGIAWVSWAEQNDYLRRENPPILPAILTATAVATVLGGAFLIGATA